MLMQLLMEIGPRIRLPAGVRLQEAIVSQSKNIVSELKDRTVFDHYFTLTRFAIDEALKLKLIDEPKADHYKRQYCH